jgi:hypothetical protein
MPRFRWVGMLGLERGVPVDRLSPLSDLLRARLRGEFWGVWARRRRLLMSACAVVAMAIPAVAPGSASAALSWSAPALIDHERPFAMPEWVSGVSCPSASLCVAVDRVGNALTSTDPTGGASAWSTIPVAGRLQSVSCPSAVLCVAVGSAGNVLTSTNPTGGPGAWTVAKADGSNDLSGVSCPSASLCVAVDREGNVLTSTNPAGGSGAWTATRVDGSNNLSGVSCASAALCVAVDQAGNAVASTDPTGGAGAWTVAPVDAAYDLRGVSCPSSILCVAVGVSGSVVTSTNPTGGSGAWTKTRVGGAHALLGVACASTSLCVAVGVQNVVTSTNPTGGAGAWTVSTVDTGNTLSDVACASASLCVAGDQAGNVAVSTGPTGGAGAWTITNIDGTNPLTGVSCPSESLCVAVDRGGNVVTSTDPTGGAAAWRIARVDPTGVLCGGLSNEICFGLTGVSCPSASLCVAVDLKGNVVTSTHPTADVSAWHVAHVDTRGVGCSYGGNCYGLSGVSCQSVSLCVAVDGDGNVVTSTNPTGGASAWHIAHVDAASLCTPGSGCFGLSGVSCPSRSLCVASDQQGNVVTSANPTGGAHAWTTTKVNSSIAGVFTSVGVSCPSLAFCVAVNGGGSAGGVGTAVTSTSPTGGSRAWVTTKVDGNQSLMAVSCAPGTSLCVAGDNGGNAVTSINPAGGARAWSTTNIDNRAISTTTNVTDLGLSGVSCPSASLCIAVDSLGSVLVGQGPAPRPPSNRSLPKISGHTVQGQKVTETHGSWTHSPILFAYQWEHCARSGRGCKAIAGATSQTFRLRAADVGHTIRVRESATNGGGTSRPATSSATAAVSLSAAQIRAQLLKDLALRGNAAKIAAVLKKGGYALSFNALTAGKAAIAWYYLPKGAHLTTGRPAPVLVANAKKTLTKAGTAKILIKLTTVGRQLLKGIKRIKLTAKGTFTPTHQHAVVAIKTFTLTR